MGLEFKSSLYLAGNLNAGLFFCFLNGDLNTAGPRIPNMFGIRIVRFRLFLNGSVFKWF